MSEFSTRTDFERNNYELIALRYKYDFFQIVLISSSTLLGVLIALLPQQFQPIEARTLYLYCCIALALCSLISGTLLFLLREHPFHLMIKNEIEQHKHPETDKLYMKLELYHHLENFLGFFLFFLLFVVFALLFLFLFLMLCPENDLMKELIPYLPMLIQKIFLSVVVIRIVCFIYKILRIGLESF